MTTTAACSANKKGNFPAFSILFRLLQNRKSAKKCRLKKKAEFSDMQLEYQQMLRENDELKYQVSVHLKLARFTY